MLTAIVVMALFCLFSYVQAAPQDDAKALAEKAAAYVKANGKEKAMAEFNNPKGQFSKGDLYIFANDFNGVCQANGGNPKLTGQNHLGLKDATDKYFMKEMVETAKTKGSGWINYSWTNPATKKVQAKVAWVQRVEGADCFVGCGVYK
jgi:signal transduction histidine kinase